ncbi:MAG TPA: ExeM/NucH family extracellular endonuclease, partial [Gammaproteobacteria bacterium]|nr:ExeM/NucH family extracellular endonuclease [Gammaproteobacteria bacterium]
GFFVQEADEQADDDPATSEGLFVFAPKNGKVAVGERLRITGTVSEHHQRTELTRIRRLVRCGRAPLPSPGRLSLGAAELGELERWEGMLVEVGDPLTLTDTRDLGRYHQLALASERLYQPTQQQLPGRAALLADSRRPLLFLADGSRQQHPAVIGYPPPALTAERSVRAGDRVFKLRGVIDQFNGAYLLHPTAPVQFEAANPRPPQPPPVPAGHLRVAAFNLQNYFNGDGRGGGFPTARGATSRYEFQRQRQKIVSAALGLGADILGVMELENDGYGSNGAIVDLSRAIGAASGVRHAFIDPGLARLGEDAITVGLLYRPDRVRPVGAPAILHSGNDARFAARNRPALAQTFEQLANGERLTVVATHLKSKGSACTGDPDRRDGQGRCNLTRTRAAQALADWLATDPTANGDPDVLLIGDLNAYAQEDPLRALTARGYHDLIGRYLGEPAYTFVFNGRAGYLDHALASPSLARQVAAVRIWHINADEPAVLDYSTAHKSRRQIETLFDPGPYRSSDHDPVIVDLALGAKLPLCGSRTAPASACQ